jgi:hypothetical protein
VHEHALVDRIELEAAQTRAGRLAGNGRAAFAPIEAWLPDDVVRRRLGELAALGIQLKDRDAGARGADENPVIDAVQRR